MNGMSGFEILLRFLRILVIRKKLIVLGTLVPTLVAVVAVLLATSTYMSQALVNAPQKESASPLDALQGVSGMGGLFGALLGGESGYDDCISILASTRFAQQVITKFDLETSYGFRKPGKKPRKFYKADVIKRFRQHYGYEDTEEGAIRISVRDTSAARAAEMLQYMIFLLDSLYTDVQKTAIKQNLGYIDGRLRASEAEMRTTEESLIAFQKKHNLYVPEAQVKVILENATQTEIRLEGIKEAMALEASLRGKSSGRYQDLMVQRDLLEKTLQSRLGNKPNPDRLILPTKSLPGLAADYFRLERDFAIRLGVYKYLVQQAELLKLDANKNIKVISVIDPPWVNEKRISPKRRIIVQAVFILSAVFSIALAVLLTAWEAYRSKDPDVDAMIRSIRSGLRFRS